MSNFLGIIWARGKEKRAMVFQGLLLAALVVLWFSNTGAPPSQAPTEDIETSSASRTVPPAPIKIDVVAAKAVTLRDPFAAAGNTEAHETPQMVKGKAPAALHAQTQRKNPRSVPVKQAVKAKLVVSGIAACGENRAAIFEYGAQRFVCKENEAVGPYRVLEILPDGVKLQGPDGVVNLNVGR